MAIESDFDEMMNDTVTVYARTSASFYGKPTFSGSGTSLACRVEEGRNVTRGADGRDITEDGQIYVFGTSTVTVDHDVVLPDGSHVRVVAVETLSDQVGAHHTVIHYGRGAGGAP